MSFFAIPLFGIYLFETVKPFISISPIGHLQFLRASESPWMENAPLNYCKRTTLAAPYEKCSLDV